MYQMVQNQITITTFGFIIMTHSIKNKRNIKLFRWVHMYGILFHFINANLLGGFDSALLKFA